MRAFHIPDDILGMDRLDDIQQNRRIHGTLHPGFSLRGIMCDSPCGIYKGIQERRKEIVQLQLQHN